MEFVDFFAGIGGFRKGMEAAGHKCVGWIEWEKHARKSYEAINDTKGEWTAYDIRGVKSFEIPRAGAWCIGFPCNDVSIQGGKEGLAGEKSGLFHTVIQLLAEKEQEDKPSYLVIENVKNLLSVNKGWDFAQILFSLEKCGYDAEWQIINSNGYLAQDRHRVYVIGHLRGRRTGKVFPVGRTSQNTIRIKGKLQLNKWMDFMKRIYDPSGLAPTLTRSTGGLTKPKVYVNGRIRELMPIEFWRLQGFSDEDFYKAAEVNSNVQLYSQAGNSVSIPVIYEMAKRLV